MDEFFRNVRRTALIKALRDRFLKSVAPELLHWGLEPHPNTTASFGSTSFGYRYRYDFADCGDMSAIKLVSFAIRNSSAGSLELWIAAGFTSKTECLSNLPIICCNYENLFILKPRRTLWHPLRTSFVCRKKKSETIEEAALRLMQDIYGQLPRLKKFLYC